MKFKQFLIEQEPFGGGPPMGGGGPLGAAPGGDLGGLGGPPMGGGPPGGGLGGPPMGGDLGGMGAPMGGAPMGGQPQAPQKPKTYDVWKTLKELLGMQSESPSKKPQDMVSSPSLQHLMS